MKTDFAKGAAWAIHPERFDEIARRYHETQITDELILKAEKEALVFNMGKSGDEAPYEITEDGTAIVKVAGPLMKSPDFFDRLFGAVGYEDIQRAVLAAIDDQRVNGIVLDIDSPGGTVNGADETAEMIFNARGQKPIVAFSSGMMASAAYMVGSAADKIVVGKNAELGSIGVLMIHTDYSKAMEKVGVKRTYLKAGRFKALGNPAEPLSDAAREVFQAELNHIYGNFIDTVALNRDVESEKVRADMADGRIFIGNQAVGVGLADEVGNLQTALAYASGDEISTRRQDEMKIETYEQLKAAAPEILKAAEDTARNDGVKSINFEGIQKEAADAAMAKVIGMAEVHFGAEAGAKFKSLVESGISVEQYKATVAAIGQPPAAASNVAEEEARKAALATLKESGAQNPGSGNPPTGGKDYMILVEEYSAAHKCSKTEAMYAINKSHPQARQDFINKDNPGLTVAK
jgi:signal peptide peptidase SppA